MMEEIKEMADNVLNYLETLPNETEITMKGAIIASNNKEIPDDCEYIAIDDLVRKFAKKRGLILDDSRYEDFIVGMIYDIPFTIRRKSKLN